MPDEIYQPKKYSEDPAEKFARKYPHHHQTYFNRPDFTRRRFFQLAGAGLGGTPASRRADRTRVRGLASRAGGLDL